MAACKKPCGTRGAVGMEGWHHPCIHATLRMRHISVVLLLIAAFAGLPAQGVAQRALKDHRFWAVPRVNAQRASVWRLPGVASASPIRASVGLTVLSAPRPALPRLNWSQTDLTLAGAFTVAVLVAAAVAPARVRPWLLGAALAVEAFTIAGTTQQGIAIRF